MTTDLFTVHPDEPLDLVANLMDWKRIRHIPVEDEQGKLAGLISCFDVLHHCSPPLRQTDSDPVSVRAVMQLNPLTLPPETLIVEAVDRMRQEKSDYLLVVKEGRLVGIVTERDLCVFEEVTAPSPQPSPSGRGRRKSTEHATLYQ